jgi:hypothetical protein
MSSKKEIASKKNTSKSASTRKQGIGSKMQKANKFKAAAQKKGVAVKGRNSVATKISSVQRGANESIKSRKAAGRKANKGVTAKSKPKAAPKANNRAKVEFQVFA